MNAQAGQMQRVMADLSVLVGGKNNEKKKFEPDQKPAPQEKWLGAANPETPQENKKKSQASYFNGQGVIPEQVIPLESDDFKDF